jgi:trimethylamine monooxygenase
MYDNLWTNGASHLIEYSDYTFDEHFQRPVTVYMKRKDLLNYIIGRVTKNCPEFFEKYVRFNTEITLVAFNESTQMFDIDLKDLKTEQAETCSFHKCIWACGDNGKTKVPEATVSILREGGFKGKIIHSAHTSNFEEDVRGKRILIVGGNYSAEDLALQSIKLGVEKVYLACRSSEPTAAANKVWPDEKVEMVLSHRIAAVTENGTCIVLEEVEWVWKCYEAGDGKTEIRNIDTVIFCTGYNQSLDMLDDSLKKTEDDVDVEMAFPDGWRMAPNKLTEMTGDVTPGRATYSYMLKPSRYRGVMVSS